MICMYAMLDLSVVAGPFRMSGRGYRVGVDSPGDGSTEWVS